MVIDVAESIQRLLVLGLALVQLCLELSLPQILVADPLVGLVDLVQIFERDSDACRLLRINRRQRSLIFKRLFLFLVVSEFVVSCNFVRAQVAGRRLQHGALVEEIQVLREPFSICWFLLLFIFYLINDSSFIWLAG